jgi:hypothetical protein
MAAEMMQAMPMSPRQSPKEIGSAAVQWACTRRGRMLVLTLVFFTIILGLGGLHNREVSWHLQFQDCVARKKRICAADVSSLWGLSSGY